MISILYISTAIMEKEGGSPKKLKILRTSYVYDPHDKSCAQKQKTNSNRDSTFHEPGERDMIGAARAQVGGSDISLPPFKSQCNVP